MEITLQKPLSDTSRNILLKAGYKDHFDSNTEKTSYSLRLGSGRYPRFHCYVKEDDSRLIFSLHIDQKETSYEGASHMHSGEYEGTLVQNEIERIRRWALARAQKTEEYELKQKKKGWITKIFGSGGDDDEY